MYLYIDKQDLKWIALTFSIKGIFKKSSNHVSNDWIWCLLASKSVEIVFSMLKPVFYVGIIESITNQKLKMDEMGPKVGFWLFFGDLR